MQFKKVFLGRRSIRKYKDKKIPTSLIGEILDLARFSPSAGNLQNWKFLIVTDVNKKNAIAEACFQQYWMTSAPAIIIICNDYSNVKKHYGKLGQMFSIQNCANVAFAIELIAYDMGLSSSWVGAFDNEALHRDFDIPENLDPEIVLTLGYADEVKKPSMREDLKYITFFEKWGDKFEAIPSHLDKFKDFSNIKKHIKKLKKK
ncbi:MAG: nitroreductase family protein [Nanoarchaeota archaeon]|nr:nitroreductase family protein [Nanoarchaeota archaeon]